MLQWLYTHVERMFQVFHLDIAEVDLECCITCTLQAYVFKCFKCFIHILQVFLLDVTYTCSGFSSVLDICFGVSAVSDVCCKSRIVLHMLQWNPPAAGAPPCVTPQAGTWILACTKRSRRGQALHTHEKSQHRKQSGVSDAGNGATQGDLHLCKQIPRMHGLGLGAVSGARTHPAARHQGTSCPTIVDFPSSHQNNIGLAQ
jgi:hypothetical protein